MTDKSALCRLTYVSRNAVGADLEGLEAEVANILAASQRNNSAVGGTGALLFNSECFAQTLEGGMDEVAATFERIQCDDRHRETVILHAGPVAEREFGDWSMAYAGRVEDTKLQFDKLTAKHSTIDRSDNAHSILSLMRGVALRAEID